MRIETGTDEIEENPDHREVQGPQGPSGPIIAEPPSTVVSSPTLDSLGSSSCQPIEVTEHPPGRVELSPVNSSRLRNLIVPGPPETKASLVNALLLATRMVTRKGAMTCSSSRLESSA